MDRTRHFYVLIMFIYALQVRLNMTFIIFNLNFVFVFKMLTWLYQFSWLFRCIPKIFMSFVGSIKILFVCRGGELIFFLYKSRILLDFVGPNLNPVDFSHLLISSMAFCIKVFDVFIFLPMQYIYCYHQQTWSFWKGAYIILGNSLIAIIKSVTLRLDSWGMSFRNW